jgi:hypothetical protein
MENLFTGANHVLNIDGEFNKLKLVGDVCKAPGLDDQPEMWEDGTASHDMPPGYQDKQPEVWQDCYRNTFGSTSS